MCAHLQSQQRKSRKIRTLRSVRQSCQLRRPTTPRPLQSSFARLVICVHDPRRLDEFNARVLFLNPFVAQDRELVLIDSIRVIRRRVKDRVRSAFFLFTDDEKGPTISRSMSLWLGSSWVSGAKGLPVSSVSWVRSYVSYVVVRSLLSLLTLAAVPERIPRRNE